METVNLVGFITYFSDYYPVLIPSAIACCLLLAWIADWLRIQIISYVDDGEGGPYKQYVEPFLTKLNKLSIPILHYSDVRITSHSPSTHIYGIKLKDGRYMWASHAADQVAMEKYFSLYGEVYVEKQVEAIKQCGVPDIPTPVLLTFQLLGLGVLLACYKFFPSITIGVLLGYGLLRMARSITRLTKKFKKHISDGHGA